MKRRLLPFALWFFALTVPLTGVWLAWGRELYAEGLVRLLGALLDTPRARAVGGSVAAARFISVVPFFVLMVVTPGLGWRRRLWGSLAGLVLLAGVHLGLLALVATAEDGNGQGQRALSTLFPFVVLADAAPLVLWLVLARDFVRSAVPGLEEPGPGPDG